MTSTSTTERRGPNTAATPRKTGTATRAYPSRRAALRHQTGAKARQRGTVVAGRLPFVGIIAGLLGCGLAVTLLLTTRAAEESYQLADARGGNQQLINERARLQREVESADSAPSLAAAAAKLGMVPARDPAHLVVASDGTVVVIGKPKPAAGMLSPLLNPVLPLVDPNGNGSGRIYPDSTVLSSGVSPSQFGTESRGSGEQLVQVPVDSLVGTPGVAAVPAPAAGMPPVVAPQAGALAPAATPAGAPAAPVAAAIAPAAVAARPTGGGN